MAPLPSPQTKDSSIIDYPLTPILSFQLGQSQANSFATTGTTLWLSGQVLAAYLLDTYGGGKEKSNAGKRCVELGSGVGLVGLTLASLSFDTLMTDIPFVLQSVLLPNLRRNKTAVANLGQIEARELDWTVPSSSWDWATDSSSITSSWTDPSSQLSSDAPPSDLQPPFDLILTTDTIYMPELLPHLLSTLQALSRLSGNPPILLALERRDSNLVDQSLAQARKEGFECKMVNKGRIKKSVDKWLGWDKVDWEGVEIWKMRFKGDEKINAQG